MALRVPRIEMEHEALAVGLGRVELRIRLARRAEGVLPLAAPPQPERVVDGVAGLVPEDAHAPFVFAALDLEHLGLLERFEPRVRQIEGDGDRRRAVRSEPLVRQVEVQGEAQVARRDLRAKLRDSIGEGPFDRQREVRHADVQQRFVTQFGPVVTEGGSRHEVMCKGNTMRLFCALVTVIAMTVLLAGQERDRAKVADAFKWNLADVYPSEAAWRAQKEKITAELPSLREFQGTLGASPKTLADALEMMSRLDKELTRLYVFASMLSDQDTRLSGPQGMQQEMQQIFAKFGAEASFVEPELLKVGSAAIEKAIGAEPRLKPYAFYLRDIVRRAPHTLSDAEEKILADAGPLAGSPNNIYTILTNADFPYPTITLKDGKTMKVDQAGYSDLRTSVVREDRKAAMSAFFARAWRLRPHARHDDELERAAGAVLREVAEVLERPRGGAERSERPGVGLHASRRWRESSPADVPPLPAAAQADDGHHRRPALLRPVRAARRRSEPALHAGRSAEARHRGDGAARCRIHRCPAARLQGAMAGLVSDRRQGVGRLLQRRRLRRAPVHAAELSRAVQRREHAGARARPHDAELSCRTRRSRTRRPTIRRLSPRSRPRSTRRCSSTTC